MTQKAALLALIAVSFWGCRSSDRTIHLAHGDLTTEPPIQLTRDALPLGGSNDGKKLVLLTDFKHDKGSWEVVETDSQKVLAILAVANTNDFPVLFNADGSALFLATKDGFRSWDLASGNQSSIPSPAPKGTKQLSGGLGYNADRTIVILGGSGPGPTHIDPEVAKNSPRQILVAGGVGYYVPPGNTAGFDQYGHAWFGSKRHWMEVDQTGRSNRRTQRPGYLVADQSRDRGAMHLRDTETDIKHEGATAYVTCVWISGDRDKAISKKPNRPSRNSDNYNTALAFAGADVFAYGFLPNRNEAYVVSEAGTYLVPFTYEPRS